MGVTEFKGQKFLSTLPHDITVYDPTGEGVVFKIPAADPHQVVRLQEDGRGLCNKPEDDGYAVFNAPRFAAPENLPNMEEHPNTCLIVSMPVGHYLRDESMAGNNLWPRRLVMGPDTGPSGSVRIDGQIVGTKALLVYN